MGLQGSGYVSEARVRASGKGVRVALWSPGFCSLARGCGAGELGVWPWGLCLSPHRAQSPGPEIGHKARLRRGSKLVGRAEGPVEGGESVANSRGRARTVVLSDGFGTSAPAVAVRDEGAALPLVTHASHTARVASLPEGGWPCVIEPNISHPRLADVLKSGSLVEGCHESDD